MSLAIWWSTSIMLRMVAPSLVTVTSPSLSTIILSRPGGKDEEIVGLGKNNNNYVVLNNYVVI